MRIKSTKINREKLSWLLEQPVNVKIELLQHHLEICRIVVNEILGSEVDELAGVRYQRSKPHDGRYSRWGYNPGSVGMGNQRIPVSVPRVYDNEEKRNVSLKSYEQLKKLPGQDEEVMRAVLLGLSTGDYHKVITTLEDSFGLSQSTVSRKFVEQSAERLREFEERGLGNQQFVAIYVDGKYLAREQIVLAIGVNKAGMKVPLGFIQTHTENAESIGQLFRQLIRRGLKYENGLLFVIDGARGLRKAIVKTFGDKALIQRCQWHKRENVISYLKKEDQKIFKHRLLKAHRLEKYEDAKAELLIIKAELEKFNRSAAQSLEEGLDETLTIHRLGLYKTFGKSFCTTNCIENFNSQMEKYIRKVKYWKNSDERFRWVAAALLEIEKKTRKVSNHTKLHQLRKAICEAVIKQEKKKNAA